MNVEFYWNCRITDFGLKKLAMVNPNLEYVNLSGCKYLSDSSIITLSQNCPNIYHFVNTHSIMIIEIELDKDT